jgi:hypothetical protein
MKLIPVLLFCCISLGLRSQVGIRAGAGLSNFDMWQEETALAANDRQLQILNQSQHLGLDYWFRLPRRRIEFLPQIGYSRYTSPSSNLFNFKGSSIDAAFNVQIYFMDLAEDCDCPTFSKQGGLVKKGLFFTVAPLAKFFTFQGSNETVNASIKEFAPGLKIGMGLDIGITDMITITPMIAHERTTMVTWDNFSSIIKPITVVENISSNYGKTYGEIRLGLRFDGGKKIGRR